MPAVAELLSFTIDFGMDLQAAFHQPRLDESARGIVTIDRRLGDGLARLIAQKLGPVEKGAADAFPMLFANPSAVMRANGVNIGMGEVTSPWAGAAAETR
jgi:gamma-glutamyltranspeptidase/glutathione hydrolase